MASSTLLVLSVRSPLLPVPVANCRRQHGVGPARCGTEGLDLRTADGLQRKGSSMNGTIKCISGQTGSGAIRSAHGETFDFELTGVLALPSSPKESWYISILRVAHRRRQLTYRSIRHATSLPAGTAIERSCVFVTLGSSMKATSASIVSRGSHHENRPKRS